PTERARFGGPLSFSDRSRWIRGQTLGHRLERGCDSGNERTGTERRVDLARCLQAGGGVLSSLERREAAAGARECVRAFDNVHENLPLFACLLVELERSLELASRLRNDRLRRDQHVLASWCKSGGLAQKRLRDGEIADRARDTNGVRQRHRPVAAL